MSSGPAGPGLFESLRMMFATLLALVHTRLELASVEIEQEVQRLTAIVLWAIVAVFCGGLAVLMLAVTVVIAFWDGHRLLAAVLVMLLFLAVAVAAGLVVRRRLQARPPLLSATLGELGRDVRGLEGRP